MNTRHDKAALHLTVFLDPKYEEEVSGCTASVGLISKTTIYVVSWLIGCCRTWGLTIAQANAGDSRSVLGVKGRAKPLSFDHKPQNEGEPRPFALEVYAVS